ncbi:MAG: hypothetical protein FJZ00_00880 [Candidatus Sericytochromatia bacterium]|uniref:Uncharacterized protein n=1 Tax=Candidatus Tanganyikabacteria bacterium TaxID=2961651 RepID=A0A937X4X4_9BACT|nr:hypothetical protein [Candidatus Tanganyikabacteria bacterium]
MGANDNYQFGRTGPLGRVSFGDKNYSDKFVRSETQALGGKKRTAPLHVTGDLVGRMVDQADDQLRTCRIIVDKFNQRMRILQWAEEISRSPEMGQPLSDPETDPEPAPPKKGLFGLGAKKPAPAAKKPLAKPGGLGAKPAGAGTGAVAARAEKVPKVKTSVQVNPQEQSLGMAISKAIARSPETRRRVQIAVYQYQVATQAVNDGENALDRLRNLDPYDAFAELEALDVAKIQGKIYPICNFHEVFKTDAEITKLFPPPSGPGPGMSNTTA